MFRLFQHSALWKRCFKGQITTQNDIDHEKKTKIYICKEVTFGKEGVAVIVSRNPQWPLEGSVVNRQSINTVSQPRWAVLSLVHGPHRCFGCAGRTWRIRRQKSRCCPPETPVRPPPPPPLFFPCSLLSPFLIKLQPSDTRTRLRRAGWRGDAPRTPANSGVRTTPIQALRAERIGRILKRAEK